MDAMSIASISRTSFVERSAAGSRQSSDGIVVTAPAENQEKERHHVVRHSSFEKNWLYVCANFEM